LAFEQVHEAVYREHAFELVDVPASTLDGRVTIVEAHLAAKQKEPPTPGRPWSDR